MISRISSLLKISCNSALLFGIIYTFCMYDNGASIMYPVMVWSAVLIMYNLNDKRRFFDNKLSGFYLIMLGLISVSLVFTNDVKLIFMSRTLNVILYALLMIELFIDRGQIENFQYINASLMLYIGGLEKGLGFFRETGEYIKSLRNNSDIKKEINPNIKKVIKGVVITIPLLIIIIPLMMSADVMFSQYVSKLFDLSWMFRRFKFNLDIVEIVIELCMAMIIFYGIIKTVIKDSIYVTGAPERLNEQVTAITVTGIITMIYLLFSIVTVSGLFNSNLNLPEKYTYAQYAREGFFQLFALALINMTIVLVCVAKFDCGKVLKGILYIMCSLTYVMIFVSTYKMLLYISVYELTFLRFMVLWALAVMSVIGIILIKYIYNNNFSLFKAMFIAGSVAYLLVAFGRPDYIVASYNLNSNVATDNYYTSDLSTDAAAVIFNHRSEMKEKEVVYYIRKLDSVEECGIRDFNVSRYIACKLR